MKAHSFLIVLEIAVKVSVSLQPKCRKYMNQKTPTISSGFLFAITQENLVTAKNLICHLRGQNCICPLTGV